MLFAVKESHGIVCLVLVRDGNGIVDDRVYAWMHLWMGLRVSDLCTSMSHTCIHIFIHVCVRAHTRVCVVTCLYMSMGALIATNHNRSKVGIGHLAVRTEA